MMFCRPRSLIGLHSAFVLGEKNFSGRHLQFVLREAKMSSTVDKMSGYQQAAKLVIENTIPEHAKLIDCRSDTVTKPDHEMRLAMMNAEVGDDVYREDPTVNELERRVADMLGKEAALFVPSGTMSNLIALLCHCHARGSEAIIGDESHILHYEQTGAAQFGGINLRAVKTFQDGTLDLDEIASKVQGSDVHQSVTELICLENTHNRCGGRVVPLEWTRKVSMFAKEHGLKLHLDGARIFNAAVALGVTAAEIANPFDSVSVCLSKGLGAPVGSLIVGSKSFIEKALRCRKALGGGMRQAGILAAAGLIALEKGPARMVQDHKFTKRIAEAALEAGHGIVTVDMETVETNMVMLQVVPDSGVTTQSLVQRLSITTDAETAVMGDIRIFAYPMTKKNVRIVVHWNLTEEDITLAERKIRYVLNELRKTVQNGH